MFSDVKRASTGAHIAVVMACGFPTFYSLPDGIPFQGRLTTMVVTQIAVDKALRRKERRDER